MMVMQAHVKCNETVAESSRGGRDDWADRKRKQARGGSMEVLKLLEM